MSHTGALLAQQDYSPFYQEGSDSLAGDAAAAGALLDTAGWTMDTSLETCVDTDSSGDDCTFTPGDSSSCGAGCDYSPPKRTDSDGNVLTLHLVAYTARPGLPIMQPVIASALTALGITVTSTTTDNWGDHDAIMAARSWDLLMWAQNTLPAGDPLWFLNHFFHSGGSDTSGYCGTGCKGNNFMNLDSAAVDSALDALSLAGPGAPRVAASAAVQTAILAERAVSNLVTPFWHVSLSDRFRGEETVMLSQFVAPSISLTLHVSPL